MTSIKTKAVMSDADMPSRESVLRELTSVQKHTMNSPIPLRTSAKPWFLQGFRAAHHETANESPSRFQKNNSKW